MDPKEYNFGGVRVVEIQDDEMARLEIYAPNAEDFNRDYGVDPCGGALGPCGGGTIFT